jgi:hypothetical protein
MLAAIHNVSRIATSAEACQVFINTSLESWSPGQLQSSGRHQTIRLQLTVAPW